MKTITQLVHQLAPELPALSCRRGTGSAVFCGQSFAQYYVVWPRTRQTSKYHRRFVVCFADSVYLVFEQKNNARRYQKIYTSS